MYSDVFCKVYNEFGWNYYPEIFAEQLLEWLRRRGFAPRTSLDLACGTGVLCEKLFEAGIRAAGMDFSAGMIDIARKRNPAISYDVADMTSYCPDAEFDLVTCTGDSLNHVAALSDVERIFRCVYRYTAPGGYFIFDILSENEVSAGEPVEAELEDGGRLWFQMTRPGENAVALTVRVYEGGELRFEEIIHETLHDPEAVCELLRRCGFTVESCADRLLSDSAPGTTWFVVAKKPEA